MHVEEILKRIILKERRVKAQMEIRSLYLLERWMSRPPDCAKLHLHRTMPRATTRKSAPRNTLKHYR